MRLFAKFFKFNAKIRIQMHPMHHAGAFFMIHHPFTKFKDFTMPFQTIERKSKF